MKIVAGISAGLGVLLFGYLFGAFVSTTLNIKEWDGFCRFALATLSTIGAAAAFVGAYENTK